MTVRCLASWTAAFSPLIAVVWASAQVPGVVPHATVQLKIDGTNLQTLIVPGSPLPDGRFKYTSEWGDGTGLTVLVNYTLDALNDPSSFVTGQCKITNGSSGPRSVEAGILFSLCPKIPGGTLFGGSVTLLLQTNSDGGGVTCAPGASSGWSAHISGSDYQSLFFCPFQMTKTGSGSIQASTVFGAPVPSKPGPDFASSMEFHHRFSITAGEIVTATSSLVVKSLGVPATCQGDLDWNGVIDSADMGLILGEWGNVGWCLHGDLSRDGLVDGTDVGSLLGAWGPCN